MLQRQQFALPSPPGNIPAHWGPVLQISMNRKTDWNVFFALSFVAFLMALIPLGLSLYFWFQEFVKGYGEFFVGYRLSFILFLLVCTFPYIAFVVFYWKHPRLSLFIYQGGLAFQQKPSQPATLLSWSEVQRFTYRRALRHYIPANQPWREYFEYTFHVQFKSGKRLRFFLSEMNPQQREVGDQIVGVLHESGATLVPKL